MRVGKSRLWLDALVLAGAVLLGLFLSLLLPRWCPGLRLTPAEKEPSGVPVSVTGVRTGRLPGHEDAPANEDGNVFVYRLNTRVSYRDGEAPGDVMLENTAGNTCAMRVVYRLGDGTVVYRSPLLMPGEYLEWDYPDTPIPGGTHAAAADIQVFPLDGEGDAAPGDRPLVTYTEAVTLYAERRAERK